MKIKNRKSVLLVLFAALICCAATLTIVAKNKAAHGYTQTVETKIYSAATLDDDFADDKVHVVLTNQKTLSSVNYGFSPSDFDEHRGTGECAIIETDY